MPVAVNLYKIRKAKDVAGEFFQSVQKQKNQYQGFWLVSPDGKVLSALHDYKSEKTWPRETLAAIDTGLKAFGPVKPRQFEPRDPLPYRGRGVQPDGQVTLAIIIRLVFSGKIEGPSILDSLTLSDKEWAKFAPPEAVLGRKWTIPNPLAGKFCRCLTPSTDQPHMPLPDEVTEVELVGTVRALAKGIATLSYAGSIAAVHKHPWEKGRTNRGRAKIHGAAAYDVEQRQLLSVTLFLEGLHWPYNPYNGAGYHVAAGVEWRRDKGK